MQLIKTVSRDVVGLVVISLKRFSVNGTTTMHQQHKGTFWVIDQHINQ